MKIQTFTTITDFITATVQFILSLNPKTVALSGGTTPEDIYEALSEKDCSDIEFYQVDERYVPYRDSASNCRMIRETLQKPLHYFDTTLPIKDALTKYEQELPLQFDLVILGIGDDGHTASLFPYSPALTEHRRVAHTESEDSTPKDRLTLTFSPILNSKTILVLLDNKPEILAELKSPSRLPKTFPALKLLSHPNLHIFYNSFTN